MAQYRRAMRVLPGPIATAAIGAIRIDVPIDGDPIRPRLGWDFGYGAKAPLALSATAKAEIAAEAAEAKAMQRGNRARSRAAREAEAEALVKAWESGEAFDSDD